MARAEKQAMESRLAGMTEEQKNQLLLELAEGMRVGDDEAGRGRVQSAQAILELRPKVEVWTRYPRTGRIDMRTQDRKVWETPGVLDPMATEDQPDRPQIIKVVDQQTGETLFERDTVLSQPTPGAPVPIHQQVATIPGADDADLASRLVALLRVNPELRKAVAEMANAEEGAQTAPPVPGASPAAGLPPLTEADGPTGPTKRQRRRAMAGVPDPDGAEE